MAIWKHLLKIIFDDTAFHDTRHHLYEKSQIFLEFHIGKIVSLSHAFLSWTTIAIYPDAFPICVGTGKKQS